MDEKRQETEDKPGLPVSLTFSSPDDANHLQGELGPLLGEMHMRLAQLPPHADQATTCVNCNSAGLLKKKTPTPLLPSQSHAISLVA